MTTTEANQEVDLKGSEAKKKLEDLSFENISGSLLAGLRGQKGSRKPTKRLGRGHSTGHGGTSSKGHKGQKARTGGKIRRGFEGGQTPIMRRLPKFGFNNKRFQDRPEVVLTGSLNRFTGDNEIDATVLREAGLIRGDKFKVILGGEIKGPLKLKVAKISRGAKLMVETAGGSVEGGI